MTASKKSGRHPRLRPRDDTSFAWASAHVRLMGWQRPLAEWAAQHSNRKVAAVFGNKTLDCVLNQTDFPPSPESFCRRINTAAHALFLKQMDVGGSANIAFLRSAARTFFEWYLQTYVSATDDNGRVWVSPEHLNPIWVTKNSATASESTRRAMPTRFLRELLEILTAEDWAWARAQADDHVEVVRDGEPRRVWCPVRASVLALKLLLPLRTFQVRFLESSEGDDVCWRGSRWQPNCGPCAPGPGVVRRRGFLHRIEDSETGSDGIGFYVNTNKTADAHQRAGEKGYVIPWQNSQAIAVVEQLEAWHAAHNPIVTPSAWSSLHDSQVCRSAPRSGAACFLMRDPGGMYANEPISDARVRYLWNRLVAELERRMAERGETMANGEPVVLTRRSKSGAVHSRYDLHTLRVSLITALAVDGGLPLHILSKCVAGHASIVMTLYYVKVSRETMNEQLDAATARVDARAQERFAQYLKSEMGDDIAVVSNDPAALAVAREGDTASWMTMDTGMCPVGATRCHDGGPSLGKGIHGPVPDGPRNCCRCRFHLTGPAFLSGLVAKFNATSLGRNAAARECETATNLLREIEDRRVETECRGEAFDARAMDRARERLDRAETRLASVGASLCAIADLVVRVRKIVSKSPPGLQLVAIGDERDVRVAIETTSDIDLADRVCQVAHIHPSTEATEASMRRAQAIDRMALRYGHTPIMLQLSDAEALRAGNEMVQLMSAQLGRDNAMQLLGGGEHLVEGVADLIDGWMAGAAGRMSIPKGEPLDQLRIGHGG